MQIRPGELTFHEVVYLGRVLTLQIVAVCRVLSFCNLRANLQAQDSLIDMLRFQVGEFLLQVPVLLASLIAGLRGDHAARLPRQRGIIMHERCEGTGHFAKVVFRLP